MIALIAFIAAVVVAAVVAPATNSGELERAPVGARPANTHPIHRVRTGADVLAIDRALRFAPYVSAGSARHRVIALTFDDGPGPYTPQIVNVLARMHATATFFIVGRLLGDFSSGLRDELRHQFAIGDHTETHAPLTFLGSSLQYGQIHDAAVAAARLGAPFPRLFRPPYGEYDTQTLEILRSLHMLMVMWSIDPRDWTRPGARTIVTRVLDAAAPGRIVELHDGGGDRSETVAALPAIINGLRRMHYGLVTVPQLLALDPPHSHQHLPAAGAS